MLPGLLGRQAKLAHRVRQVRRVRPDSPDLLAALVQPVPKVIRDPVVPQDYRV